MDKLLFVLVVCFTLLLLNMLSNVKIRITFNGRTDKEIIEDKRKEIEKQKEKDKNEDEDGDEK
jgi:hypothetical protein